MYPGSDGASRSEKLDEQAAKTTTFAAKVCDTLLSGVFRGCNEGAIILWH